MSIRFDPYLPVRERSCRLIAELGTCGGNLDYALNAARAAAQSGAWAVKVQMHRPETLVTEDAPRYDTTSGGAPTQFETVAEALPYDRWEVVKQLCDDLGVMFFASVFDFDAVDACEEMGVQAYKIASGDITYRQLIQYVGATDKPVFLSTGASRLAEIMEARDWLAYGPSKLVLMACSLVYPCPAEHANISRISGLRRAFPNYMIGYSDHTRGPHSAWMVGAYGGVVLEKHFTIMPGTGLDHDFAATPNEFVQMQAALDMTKVLRGEQQVFPVHAERDARNGARRSVVAGRWIKAGEKIRTEDLDFLRPGVGIPPHMADLLIGAMATRDLPLGHIIEWNDVKVD